MNLKERVGLNLQDARRAKGVSQEELAHRANVNRGYVGKIENAKYSASLTTLEKIARALNIDPSELLKTPQLGGRPTSCSGTARG